MIRTYQGFVIIIFCFYCFNAYGFDTKEDIHDLAKILSEKVCKIEVNDVDNLVAMCRECHGQKTTIENL